MKRLGNLLARLRPSDEETFGRFGGWLAEDFEVQESEQLLIGADATFFSRVWRNLTGTLYLTNQRVLFSSLRRWRQEKLELRLSDIDAFGSDVPWHVALSNPFQRGWFVEARGVRHYFATNPEGRALFLARLADLTRGVRDDGS